MVCAPLPLKSIVLPVIVYALLAGGSVGAVWRVRLSASQCTQIELLVRLVELIARMDCSLPPLKSIVMPVIVYVLVLGVNVLATPIVPLSASVRAPVELLVRLL